MKRLSRKSMLSVFSVAVALLSGATLSAEQADSQPNVVFILIDDLGWADLRCYGNTFHESPHIDRLVAGGMRFTNAYAASPVCSSTRCSLMTGKYPATVGITDFIPGHWRPWEKLIVPPIKNELPLDEITIAEPLQAAGYATGYFGKWHLGGPAHYPHKQGFDVALVQQGSHFKTKLGGTREVQPPADAYLADVLTDEALRFIEDNRDRPFFVYLSHYAVHIPLMAKQDKIDKYERKARNQRTKYHPTYSAMIEHVDDSVGRVLDKLDELKLADNTLVIFFSDNGGLISRFDAQGETVGTNEPLRAEKGTVYEGGIREPLIVRWPGVVEPGSICVEPVTSVDFFPTIIDAAAAQQHATHEVDGVSLLPLLEQTSSLRREAIYWHYPHYHHMDPAGAIRAGSWKLIEHFDDGELELYNLADDISERKNLAGQLPGQAADLRRKLAAWRKSVGAKLPKTNPEYDPDRAHQWQRRPRPSK